MPLCESCGIIIKRKIFKDARHNGIFCSDECHNKYESEKIKMCKQCGKEFIPHKSNLKLGHGKFCSFACSTKYNLKFQKKEFTRIECEIADKLDEKNIIYYMSHSILGIAKADLYIPSHNIVIFCDGDHWHNVNKKITLERDIKQTKSLESKGYHVFRFSENNIDAQASECIESIIRFIESTQPTNHQMALA